MDAKAWYLNNKDVNSPDIIHQILMFGTLKDIKSLKKTLGENKLKKLFLNFPKKIYTSCALNFIKNFILHINIQIDEQKYLKTSSRTIG